MNGDVNSRIRELLHALRDDPSISTSDIRYLTHVLKQRRAMAKPAPQHKCYGSNSSVRSRIVRKSWLEELQFCHDLILDLEQKYHEKDRLLTTIQDTLCVMSSGCIQTEKLRDMLHALSIAKEPDKLKSNMEEFLRHPPVSCAKYRLTHASHSLNRMSKEC
jgi:hypothetical protein